MKPRSFFPLVLLMIVAATTLPACHNKKNDAAKAYKTALAETGKNLKALTTTFPTKMTELDKLETSDPAAGAKLINTELLPVVDAVVDSMHKAGEAGKKYVEVASDEDPKVMAGIKKNIDVNDRQVKGYAELRTLLADEAALLQKGPLSSADETRIAQGIVTAMSGVANAN